MYKLGQWYNLGDQQPRISGGLFIRQVTDTLFVYVKAHGRDSGCYREEKQYLFHWGCVDLATADPGIIQDAVDWRWGGDFVDDYAEAPFDMVDAIASYSPYYDAEGGTLVTPDWYEGLRFAKRDALALREVVACTP